KILEKMVLDESLEANVKAAQVKLDAEKKEVDKEKAVVAKRTAEYQARLDEDKKRRAEIAAKVGERALSEYTRLSRKPPAIAEIRNGSCGGCRVLLRPQALNEARLNSE